MRAAGYENNGRILFAIAATAAWGNLHWVTLDWEDVILSRHHMQQIAWLHVLSGTDTHHYFLWKRSEVISKAWGAMTLQEKGPRSTKPRDILTSLPTSGPQSPSPALTKQSSLTRSEFTRTLHSHPLLPIVRCTSWHLMYPLSVCQT